MTTNLKTQKAKNKVKKYNEYIKTRPEQLDLFSLSNVFESKRDKYSNTVELYDTIPKYFHGDVEKIREDGKYLDILTREFVHRKQKMTLNITPALLLQKDKTTKAFFPSQREEIIEDVLRKFATKPDRNEFLDDRLAVRFTLYDLWKELRRVKHKYDYDEIMESLEILSKTNLEIKSSDDEITFSSNMFETFGMINENKNKTKNSEDQEESEERGKKITYFIRFNSLVSGSIRDKSWRIINYDQCMAYRKVISRWLHKRISHMFLVGDIQIPYIIKLSTIIRDSGMAEYNRIKDNIRQVEDCLKEMITIGSIDKYEIEKIYSEERKNKIEDAKFILHVSNSFYEDAKLNHLVFKSEKEIKQIQDNSKRVSDNEKSPNKVNGINTKNKQNDFSQPAKDKKDEIEEFISSYTEEIPKAIYRNMLKEFGQDIFTTWMTKLKYVGINEDVLTFSTENEFIKEWITRDFLDGITKTVNGETVWFRKGIKQFCQEVCPDIRKVVIKCNEL